MQLYTGLPYLLNVEWLILRSLIFLFIKNHSSSIFQANCFLGPNLHNTVDKNNMLTLFELVFFCLIVSSFIAYDLIF